MSVTLQGLCDDFYCDCDYCQSFGSPQSRRAVFAALEVSDACNVGFVTGKAQRRLIADGHGKAQEQQDLQDAMREDAYRLVGSDDAAECVFQYVLGYMVGLNAKTEEEDWAAEEAAWLEEQAWQASCGYGLDQDK